MAQISFDTDRRSMDMIFKIAQRALASNMARRVRRNDPYTIQDIAMDVTAVHCNGCPLRLKDLANAPSFDFAHDILGIRRHLNRNTGKLEDCFVPRFAARQTRRLK